jgi:anaerobic magnesium-protoporphyrin IX monomethyl ester cyclase
MLNQCKSKILLVTPPSLVEKYHEQFTKMLPFGILYIASYLRQYEYDVDVMDAYTLNSTMNDVVKKLRDGNFNTLGINTYLVNIVNAEALAKRVKEELPNIVIITGGHGVSVLPNKALDCPHIDYAICNEGEETFLELLQAIEGKQNFSEIKGLIYRENENVVVNPKRGYIKDLDSLPFPAYDLLPDLKFYNYFPFQIKKFPVAGIITSRGCPGRCTFCDKSVWEKSFRLRSAKNVVDELEILVNKYGIREILFVDDTFTADKKRIYEIFKLTKERNLKFSFSCASRINTIDLDLLKFMKKNGCWFIAYGIETGDEDVLKLINKNIKLENVRKVVEMTHDVGISSQGYFILGNPTETMETMDKTIAFAKSLKLDRMIACLNTPIPGTAQYETKDQYGTVVEPVYSKYNFQVPVYVPHGLTSEILSKKLMQFYKEFYFRPRIILKIITSTLNFYNVKLLIRITSMTIHLIRKFNKLKKQEKKAGILRNIKTTGGNEI